MNATAGHGPVPEGYTAERILAEDGLGRILLCTGPSGGEVVVRVLGGAGEPAAVAVAGDHECLVPVTRVWEDPQAGMCLEQPHLSGGVLQATVEPEQVVVGALRLAAALAHLHARGLLHRDVRRGTVRLDADGNWHLADAGVAHALGRVPVEAAYAPRELRGWEPPGPAADVYGLGATLHAALTGGPPREHGRIGDLPPDTPPALAALLPRMLAEDPADRPSLAEIDQMLRPPVAGEDVPALPPRRTTPAPPRPRVTGLTEAEDVPAAAKRRGTLIGVGVAVLFLIGAVGVAAANGGSDDNATQVASSSDPMSASPGPSPSSECDPAPGRGTDRCASGTYVDIGLAPYKIAVIIHQGRLTALLYMKKVNTDLKALQVNSVEPDGSKPVSGGAPLAGFRPSDVPQAFAFFFPTNVSTDRCVQVQPIRKRGRLFTDPREVCVRPETDRERALADDGFEVYRKNQEASKPTPKPTKKLVRKV